MLYAAVLHSPVAHARIRSRGRHRGRAGRRRGRRPDQRPTWPTSTRTTATRCATARSWPWARSASPASRSPWSRRETQAAADAAVALIDAEYEELPIAASVDTALAPDAPLVHEKRARPGQRARPGRPARRRRQHLLQLLVPPRRHGPGLRGRRGGGRGRVHLPRRLPVLDGDAHHDRALAGRRADPVVLLPAPVPGPAGDRRAVRAAAGPGADHRAVPRRRLRQQVLHQDGAADRGHRPQGRAPGADPQRGARVDDHHPAARHDRADAHRGRGRRDPARPGVPGLAGHRRLRGQRPPGHRHGRRRRPRAPTAGRPWTCRRTASTPTPARPAPTAPSAPPTCSGSRSRSWTRWPAASASTAWRSAARTCSAPAKRSAPAASP